MLKQQQTNTLLSCAVARLSYCGESCQPCTRAKGAAASPRSAPAFASAGADGSRGRGGCGRAFVVEVGTGRGRRRNLHRRTSSFRPHQRTPASEQTASAAPLPLICARVIRNTWLPIMTPLLSCRAEQGCEGHIYVYHRRVRTLSCSEGKYRRWRLLSRDAALQPLTLYHHACTSKGMYQPFFRLLSKRVHPNKPKIRKEVNKSDPALITEIKQICCSLINVKYSLEAKATPEHRHVWGESLRLEQ